MQKILLPLAVVCLVYGPTWAQKGPAKLPAGVTLEKDVAYGPHERQKLDVFVPAGDGPFPIVVWVHGGGWQGGSKENAPQVLRMMPQGYAAASINYRLSQHAVYPAQIHDAKAAIRYLRANAKKYKIDPDRIGVMGGSAGGHLVALLGTTGDVKELEGDIGNKDVSSRVQAVCNLFGPTDLIKLAEISNIKDSPKSPITALLGGTVQEKKDLANKANPITYATKDDAPILMLHGDKDALVPHSQSEILHDAMKKVGVESTLIVIPGAGHGNGVATPDTLAKVDAFLAKHLKSKK